MINSKKITKASKIIISVIAVFLAIVLVLLAVWMIPVKGEVSNDYWCSTMEYTEDYAVSIEKYPDKDFKILAISDVQLNDAIDIFGLKGTAYDTITKLVSEQNPDLIIVMGDTVWAAFNKVSVKQFIRFMDGFQIPWAPINGNHDSEGNVDFNWIADEFLKSEYCLLKKGPNNIGGVGNYVINIKENDKIVESLILMDSHSSRYYEDTGKTGYDFIYDSQMDWYKWVIDGVKTQNGGKDVESMLFIHIPLNEYVDAYNLYEKSGFDPSIGFGEKNEECCPGHINSGLFDVIKKTDSTKYVFAAHDHLNNFSVDYEGIRLTYTMKTGDRCSYLPKSNGGTLITIGEKVEIEHVYC